MGQPNELCLTVMGTTSSGKSSLVNLLCGRFLLPVAVQESPRVVVEIHHQPARRDIRLYHPLQPELTLDAQTDEKARFYLEQLRQQVLSAAPPSSGAFRPIRMEAALALGPPRAGWQRWWQETWNRFNGKRNLPWLSPHHAVRIRDLPGFLYRGDTAALELVEEGLAQGPALFVFNAEETDCVKEDELLRFVLERCRATGSWQRLCFILNRVDVFQRDRGREQDLEDRLVDLKRRLGYHIRDVYRLAEFPSVPVYRLATMPALLGAILTGPRRYVTAGDQVHCLERAAEYARQLLPPDLAARLPRSSKRWRRWHVRRFCQHIPSASHWYSLRQILRGHFQAAETVSR